MKEGEKYEINQSIVSIKNIGLTYVNSIPSLSGIYDFLGFWGLYLMRTKSPSFKFPNGACDTIPIGTLAILCVFTF